MQSKLIRANVSGEHGNTAYIELPGHPAELQPSCVAKTIRLDGVIHDYVGPSVNLDFSAEGRLIGIEIIVFESDHVD